MYNYHGHRGAYLKLVNSICDVNFRKLSRDKLVLIAPSFEERLDSKQSKATGGILNLLDHISDWIYYNPGMLVIMEVEELMNNTQEVESLVKIIVGIDYSMLMEQQEILRNILDYDSSLWHEHRKALEGISEIIDSISDWIAHNPEVIFDYKL